MNWPDPLLISLGLLVGTLIGLTGIGGDAVLTPLLILGVGVRPVIAVGTDLAFAAITKVVSAWQHTRRGTCDVRLALLLAIGSVPGALLGVRLVSVMEAASTASADAFVGRILGVLLLVAAGAWLLRAVDPPRSTKAQNYPGGMTTTALGLGVGVLVGLTSIGAGSLLLAVFGLLYELPVARAVGTDVLHGALLAALAAIAHAAAGRVEFPMLTSLLVGSLPGALLGALLCGRLPGRPLRFGIAGILAISGAWLL